MAQINNTTQNTAPIRKPVLRDLSFNVLLFLASRASVIGLFPFGTAFFAANCDKGIAYIGVLVLCAGLISAGAGASVIKYLIATLLYWIYIKTRRTKHIAADSAACGLSLLVGGLAVLLYNYIGIYDVMLLFTESIASAIIYVVYIKSQFFFEHRKERSKISQEEIISIAVSGGIFITGLSGKLPYNISLSGIAAVYASLCMSMHASLTAAGCGAMFIGFMSTMSSPYAVVTGGLYGLSAIFGNLLKSFGRIGIAVGFVGGISVAAICMQGTNLPIAATDAAIAAFIFALTPKKIHKKINILFSKSLHMEAISADVRIKEYLSMKLENASNAFKSLNECFINESNKRLNVYHKEVGSFLEEMSSRACTGCTMSVKCWQNDFTKTYKNIVNIFEAIENDGFLTPQSMPKSFKDRCIRCELFTSEFNHVYELYKKDIIRTGESVTERDIIAKQYLETSKLFESMSTDVLEGFSFREDLEEAVVNNLDKIGITAFEVSVTESASGRIEVYLGLGIGINIEKTENLLSEMFAMPMRLDKNDNSTLLKFISGPKFGADVAMRQIKSDESEISGDSAASFTTDDCKKYVIISDGMGSGKKAMQESRTTIKLLREFLCAGFCIETSIEMINSALCLKLENEMFSTIDLLCIDLITGMGEFYKIGAAESIIGRNGNTETVFSVSAPVGIISDIHPQGQIKKLSDGDIIVMMSDGISISGNGTSEHIKKKLRTSPSDAEETAQEMMESVIEKNHGIISDDMTLAIVKITEN